MLHIVHSISGFKEAIDFSQDGDVFLLLQKAVYCVNPAHSEYPLTSNIEVAVLLEDLEARGLSSLASQTIQQVTYAGFVNLTVQHTPNMSWY